MAGKTKSEIMKELVDRGYRSEGYQFPLWMDATDALSPKEMEKEERRWLRNRPDVAAEMGAKNPGAEEAHRERLKESPARMGGGGGGGMKPDTDITASRKLPKMKKGGSVKSASARADGIATKGKTRGRYI